MCVLVGVIALAVRGSINKRLSKHVFSLVFLGALGACADLLDLPQDPVLLQQQSPVETPPASKTCAAANPAKPARDTALVRVRACSFLVPDCLAPVTGLTANLCSKLDYDCAAPIQRGITNVGGEFVFEVPTGGLNGSGFDGYLQLQMPRALCTDELSFGMYSSLVCTLSPTCDLTRPDERCNVPLFPDSLLFFNPPITNDVVNPVRVSLVPTAQSFGLLSGAESRPQDATTGVVFVTVLDCDGKPADGATIDYEQRIALPNTLYLRDGIPAVAGSTDASGTAGLLGVPMGYKHIVATRTTPEGEQTGRVGVRVSPSMFTYVSIALSAPE